ncbi:hypothetical protein K5549_021525, partial [Capra hircus]
RIGPENEGREQPMQNGEEDSGNNRGQACQLAPNFQRTIPNDVGDRDDMEIFKAEMRKLRELQLRKCLRILMGQLSNHPDHHEECCLWP